MFMSRVSQLNHKYPPPGRPPLTLTFILSFPLGSIYLPTTEADEDAKLGQRDLDKASGANSAVKDKQTLRFLVTVGAEPDQILR